MIKKIIELIEKRRKEHEDNFKRYEKERKYAQKKKDFNQENYSDMRARQEIKIIDELDDLEIELTLLAGEKNE